MNIMGPSTVSVEAAQAWARSRNSHDRYVTVAPLYWQIAPRYNIPPEIAYVQAGHETGYGHYSGVVPSTYHNWAGLKTTKGGSNTSASAHQRFPDDATGVLAHVQHLARYAGLQAPPAGDTLVDPRWDAVTKFTDTVEGLGGAWAPAKTYGKGLVTLAENLRTFAKTHGGPTTPQPLPASPGMIGTQEMLAHLNARYPLAIRVAYIPTGNSNRPGTAAITEGRRWITVHETGNRNVGANAEMHRRYTHGHDGWGGGGHPAGMWDGNWYDKDYEGVSFTWVVDDREAINLVPRDEKSWQAGDGAGGVGNSSESIETCVNADGDWGRTTENLARLVARLVVLDNDNSPERIAQHNRWSGKNCPERLRSKGGAGWDALQLRVNAILADVGYFGGIPQPLPSPDVVQFAEVPYTVSGGFRGMWAMLDTAQHPGTDIGAEWLTLGLPRSDEFDVTIDGEPSRAQVFDRGALVWQSSQPRPWDVTKALGRVYLAILAQGIAQGAVDPVALGVVLNADGSLTVAA